MKRSAIVCVLGGVMTLPTAVFGQVLYSQNFDINDSPNWKTNNNNVGTNAADFFFDYNTVGIPSAPHSTGGSTRGIKLSANISGTSPGGSVLPGISVSPLDRSFTGDYTLKFDWWHNFLGNATSGGIGNTAGGSGSTQLSTFGVLTSGNVANYAGASDSVFFAATGDGASTADFRAYSSEKTTGYVVADTHNVYAAGGTNSSQGLYQTLFPAGATAPAAQVSVSATQEGSTLAGMAGFRWHDVEITKLGGIITWMVDGTLLSTVDTSNFTTATGGSNILFGMSDTSVAAGTPAGLFAQMDFTLIDNVSVAVAVPEPSSLVLLGVALVPIAVRRRRTSR